VTANYFAVLGRAPDGTGWNFWYNQLPSIGRTGVSNGLISSQEYNGKCDSTLSGTTYYKNDVVSGQAVGVNDGSYSPNYNCGQFGPNWFPYNTDFVTMLYLEGLGREPDTGTWILYYCGLVPSVCPGWNGPPLSQAQTVGNFIANGTEFVNHSGEQTPATPTYPANTSGTGVGGTEQYVTINYSGGTAGLSNIAWGAVFVGTGNAAAGGATAGCSFLWWQDRSVEMWESGQNGSWSSYLGSGTLGNAGSLTGSYNCSLDLANSSYKASTGVLTLALTYLWGMSGTQSVWSYAANVQNWPSFPYESLATFVIPGPVNVTLATSLPGLSLAENGFTCTSTPCTYSWMSGSSQTIGAPLTQQINGVAYVFSGWSDGGNLSHTITVPSAAVAYTATFTQQAAPQPPPSATSQSTLCPPTPGVDPWPANGTDAPPGYESYVCYNSSSNQMYGYSRTLFQGPSALYGISTTAYADMINDLGTDLDSRCSGPASSTLYRPSTGDPYVAADSRVPCSGNFSASADRDYTVIGTHSDNIGSTFGYSKASLGFAVAGGNTSFHVFLDSGTDYTGATVPSVYTLPDPGGANWTSATDGVFAAYTHQNAHDVNITLTVPYTATKGRHDIWFPTTVAGVYHPNPWFGVIVYDGTPQITSVSSTPSPIHPGSPTAITVSGHNFGTSPTVYQ